MQPGTSTFDSIWTRAARWVRPFAFVLLANAAMLALLVAVQWKLWA